MIESVLQKEMALMEAEKRLGEQEDWEVLLRFMPEEWELKAKELGALRRARNFKDGKSLLRTLLIHFVDGCSLRETVVRARLGKIAEVSDVALLKRLNCSGEWFRWMAVELMKEWVEKRPEVLFPGGYRFRVVDGSTIQEPGATGSDWRVHYSINLMTLQCDEMKVTESQVGETFKRFSVKKNDVLMGDRGYCHPGGVDSVVRHGGHVLVRINLCNLPLYRKDGSRFVIINALRTLKGVKIGDWPCYVQGSHGKIAGRLCAVRKSETAAEKSRQKVLRENGRKSHQVQPETLEAAGYTFVFTTLTKDVASSSVILEMYRGRWQIELVFKRLKSIIGIGHLPKQDPVGARAWIHGKIFTAFLIEALLASGERFFPWGYPLPQEAK